jgi:hypothetical protein
VAERVVAGAVGADRAVGIDDADGGAERGVDAEDHPSRVIGVSARRSAHPWRVMRTRRGAASSIAAMWGPAVPQALSTPVPLQPRSISTSHQRSATASANGAAHSATTTAGEVDVEIVELAVGAEPVGVDVHEAGPSASEGGAGDDEGRALHAAAHAEFGGDAARQRRLARAEGPVSTTRSPAPSARPKARPSSSISAGEAISRRPTNSSNPLCDHRFVFSPPAATPRTGRGFPRAGAQRAAVNSRRPRAAARGPMRVTIS